MEFDYQGIQGPDISFYQGNPKLNMFVDFDKMKAYGSSFVVVKAGQDNYPDPAFAYNWAAAKKALLLRAAYWFLDKDRDGKSQAQLFWSLLQSDPGEGPLIVDFEWGSGDWRLLYDFLAELLVLSKYEPHRIWIYTGYYYWIDHVQKMGATLANIAWFAQFGLWLAWYDADVQDVLVPKPWTKANMWQKGTPAIGDALGVHSLDIDWDWFNGGVPELSRYFNLNGDEIPPDNGGTVKVIQGKVIGSVKIRQSPAGAEFVPGRYLTAGMTIEASENSNQWLHLTKINDVPVTDTEWASAGSTQQYIQWQWVDVPDPTPVPAAPYKCHFEGTVTLTDPNGVVYSAPVSFDLDLNKNA